MKKQNSLRNLRGQSGFTLIEVIMVIVIIGILASIAAEKLITVTDEAEETAEDSTIEIMRANLLNNFGNSLVQGTAAEFPNDPFDNLNKIPDGFDRNKNSKPTGEDETNSTWVFVQGSGEGNVTAEEAGTTLTNFSVSGFIFHQRKDGTVVKWPYDSANGVIGRKMIDKVSELKQKQDDEKLKRGETTEGQRKSKTR